MEGMLGIFLKTNFMIKWIWKGCNKFNFHKESNRFGAVYNKIINTAFSFTNHKCKHWQEQISSDCFNSTQTTWYKTLLE